MSVRVLMLGFNNFGEHSDLPLLRSAANNFRILKTLITHEQAGASAHCEDNIQEYIDPDARDARQYIRDTIQECKATGSQLIVYITGHGVVSSTDDEFFVVPTVGSTVETASEGQSDFCLRIETDLYAELEKPGAPTAAVILDCCNAKASNKKHEKGSSKAMLGVDDGFSGAMLPGGGGANYSVISTSGSRQSAWESSWSELSPCKTGLKNTYRRVGLESDVRVSNFVGALVDVWGLSEVRLPTDFDRLLEEHDLSDTFHFHAAANLNEVVNQTREGLVSVVNAANGAKKLLQMIENTSLKQSVSVREPKGPASRLPLFRLPSPSREEKLQQLSQYINGMTSVTEQTRRKMQALIQRGQDKRTSRNSQFPHTAIELEDRLYLACTEQSEAEVVEQFLLNGVEEQIEHEIAIRSKKWTNGEALFEARETALKGENSELKAKLSEMNKSYGDSKSLIKNKNFYLWAILTYALAITALAAYLTVGISMQ